MVCNLHRYPRTWPLLHGRHCPPNSNEYTQLTRNLRSYRVCITHDRGYRQIMGLSNNKLLETCPVGTLISIGDNDYSVQQYVLFFRKNILDAIRLYHPGALLLRRNRYARRQFLLGAPALKMERRMACNQLVCKVIYNQFVRYTREGESERALGWLSRKMFCFLQKHNVGPAIYPALDFVFFLNKINFLIEIMYCLSWIGFCAA